MKKQLIIIGLLLGFIGLVGSIYLLLPQRRGTALRVRNDISSLIGRVLPVFKQRVYLENQAELPVILSDSSNEAVIKLTELNPILSRVYRINLVVVKEQQETTLSWIAENGQPIVYFSSAKKIEGSEDAAKLDIFIHLNQEEVKRYNWTDEQIDILLNLEAMTLLLDPFQHGTEDKVEVSKAQIREWIESGIKLIEYKTP